MKGPIKSRLSDDLLSEAFEFLDTGTDLILFLNSDRGVEYANPRAIQVFGLKSNLSAFSKSGSLGEELMLQWPKHIPSAGVTLDLTEPGSFQTFRFSITEKADSKSYLLIGREISQILSRERELEELRQRLLAQTKAMNVFDIVAETDRRGRITAVNDRFIEISKYTKEELLGQDHRILNSGFHSKEFFQTMWTTISRGDVWSADVRNRAKDGSIYWVRTVVAPITDTKGAIQGYLSVRRDITNEKVAEEQLLESELRFRELLDNVNFVAVGLSLHGYVTFTNQTLTQVTGFKKEELLGRDWIARFVAPEDRVRVAARFAKTLRGESETETLEFKILTWAGEHRLIQWTNTIFRSAAGDIIGLTALGEDITEKRANERKLKVLHDETEMRKEEIIGFVSHELRSPLMGINLTVSDLQTRLPQDDPAQEALKIILDRVGRIGRLGHDLMQSVMYNAGQLEFEFRPTHLGGAINRVIKRIRDQAEKKNVNIQFTPWMSPVTGYWDSERLDQVFSNLIHNAIKYSKPEGGILDIKVELLSSDRVRVLIKDSGVGIPSTDLPNIFESFSRGENVKRSKREGFGLGLKIAKDIIDRHQGRIWAESTLGDGSTFFIELPLRSE